MAEKIKLNDFIELDYTGMLKDGTIFDTTSKDVAQKSGILNEGSKFSSVIICVGEGQILPGLEQELVDKEIGKEYTIDLMPEKAFGKRDVKKIKIMPVNAFREHKMDPHPGLQIDVDGELGTITSISGGRVIVNFNHPLSGKEVVYTVKTKRVLTDKKEKLLSYLNAVLRIPLDKIKIDVADDKAKVQMPFQLPEMFLKAVEEKLAKIIGYKEVKIESIQVKEEKK